MLTGGRILHHIQRFAIHKKNSICLVGFQAAGTRGASLLAEVKSLKIHGRLVPIRSEVYYLDGLSAHADQHELTDWLKKIGSVKKVYLVHGESEASDGLRKHLHKATGKEPHVVKDGETIEFN